MKVLVIKHGALGDIVLAFPAFAAIRAAHAEAAITLLTTAPFAALLAGSPWFDRVAVDARPQVWDLRGLLRLRRQLRGYDLVYDLQTSARSSRYFALAGRPAWSGISAGCRLPHANPGRNGLHSRERLAEQLAMAGIGAAALPAPDLSWLGGDVSRFVLPPAYAVLAPGAAAHRPEKRWPARKFGELAAGLATPAVIVGTAGEAPLAGEILTHVPAGLDLTGKTSLTELAAVLGKASLVVGNDSGPLHLAAALGVSCVVLFGGGSEPALTAPRYPDGSWPRILRESYVSDLPVARVLNALP